MAFQFQTRGSASSTSNTTSYAVTPTTLTSGRCWFLLVAANAADPTSVTGHGLTWTRVAGRNNGTFWLAIYEGTGTPTSGNITATWGSNRTGCDLALAEIWDNGGLTVTVRRWGTGSSGTGTTTSDTLASTDTGDVLIGFSVAAATAAQGMTDNTDWGSGVGAGHSSPAQHHRLNYSTVLTTSPAPADIGASVAWQCLVGEFRADAATQNLTGSALYAKAPTFFTGTVARGTVALTGTLFAKAPSFFTGTVVASYATTGTLFQKAPTFFAGTSTVGTAPLTGTLFQKASTFFTGSVTPGEVALTGSLFQRSPTFFAGTVAAGTVALDGTLYTRAPTFFTGTTTVGTVALDGTLFAKAPTFFVGSVGTGGATQDLTGSLHVQAPTFFTGTLAASYALTGTLLSVAPTFQTGTVTAGTAALTGALFAKAPTFFVAAVAVEGGATQPLTGTLFVIGPSFQTGTITPGTVALTGTLFTVAPDFYAGGVTVGAVAVTGVLFQQGPTFYTGTLGGGITVYATEVEGTAGTTIEPVAASRFVDSVASSSSRLEF